MACNDRKARAKSTVVEADYCGKEGQPLTNCAIYPSSSFAHLPLPDDHLALIWDQRQAQLLGVGTGEDINVLTFACASRADAKPHPSHELRIQRKCDEI